MARPARLLVAICIATACLLGCRHDRTATPPPPPPPPPQAAVFVLFDISGSTGSKLVRQTYARDFEKVVKALPGRVVLKGEIITHNTMQTATMPIDYTAKPMSFTDVYAKHQKAAREDKAAMETSARDLIMKTNAVPKTDMMNAFQLADKVLNGEDCREARVRALVVFSDMIEQSDNYNFDAEELTPKRVQQIIKAEQSADRLPSLTGVRVWCAGAGLNPEGNMNPNKIHDIQTFWLSYFKACGADLPSSHYGPSLLNFSLAPRAAMPQRTP